jgi:YVTN family beta-propeller protein
MTIQLKQGLMFFCLMLLTTTTSQYVQATSATVATPPVKTQGVADKQPLQPEAPKTNESLAQKPPILVLNSLNADVSIIDPVTFTEIKRLPVGKEPHHLYMTPDSKSVLVANAAGNSITFIDPKTGDVQRTLNNIVDPYHLRFSPDMKWFVVAANRLNHVDIYEWLGTDAEQPIKLIKRLPAAKTPSHLMIDDQSKVVYATMQDSNELMAIDLKTQQPLWVVPTGKLPADLFLTPDNKKLLVALTGENNVQVFDVSGPKAVLVQRITTGKGAHAFRAQGDGKHVFVSNRAGNSISRIDLKTLAVVDQYPAPGGPDCMEMSADGKTLMVTSRWSGKLTFIDLATRSVVRQVAVGKSPHGVWTLDHAARQ